MKDDILMNISKILIPFIQILGVYIILNGHLSPGGGFAGGTVIGVSLILYRIVFRKERVLKKLNYNKLIKLVCFGLLFYGIMKGYSFITGGNHLNLPKPPLGNPGDILSGGFILPLNIIVGLLVAISMYFFYSLFEEGEI